MKKGIKFLLTIIFIGNFSLYGQIINDVEDYTIYTSDINHFWEAYDSLSTAKNIEDSLNVINQYYLKKKSVGLEEFIKVRPEFTGESYIAAIRTFPLFWNSIRKRTENINVEINAIKQSFEKIKNIYPEFEIPDVCFAISPIMTGGTTSEDNNIILLGTELAAIDSTIDLSEFPKQVKKILGNIYIPYFVIHESIHTAQNPLTGESGVFLETMMEGSAEFITTYLLETSYQKKSNEYGYKHEKELWDKLKVDIENNTNFNKWFGDYYQNKYPDLGYFFGYKIMQSYYKKSSDKKQALIDIIKLNYPEKIFKESGYNGTKDN